MSGIAAKLEERINEISEAALALGIDKKIRIYYPHSMMTYDTLQEEAWLDLLNGILPEGVLFNPNDPDHYDKYVKDENGDMVEKSGKQIMEELLEFVKSDECKMLIVTEHLGLIGKGVYDEIRAALDKKTPVYCLRQAEFEDGMHYYFVKVTDVKPAFIGSWDLYYGAVVTGEDLGTPAESKLLFDKANIILSDDGKFIV